MMESEDMTLQDILVESFMDKSVTSMQVDTPIHVKTKTNANEMVVRTNDQFREVVRETMNEMMTENRQTFNNHTQNIRRQKHTKRELMVYGIEEKQIENQNERKEKEKSTVTRVLKAMDKDWEGQGLMSL